MDNITEKNKLKMWERFVNRNFNAMAAKNWHCMMHFVKILWGQHLLILSNKMKYEFEI